MSILKSLPSMHWSYIQYTVLFLFFSTLGVLETDLTKFKFLNHTMHDDLLIAVRRPLEE